MDYLKKIDQPETIKQELLWNIPEQKQGDVNIIGGNGQSFRTPVKVAEYLMANYPVKNVNLVLPDALKSKLPPLPNLRFLTSTDSGSFASGDELKMVFDTADFNLLIGDISKNSITAEAVASACVICDKPVLITRDAVDAVAEKATERLLMNEKLILMASMPQLIKLFRAVYYPKMILLGQPLIQVAEALHKFTLSYPAQIITLHNGQVLVAKNGNVVTVPLEKTDYSPLSFWMGELASKIVAVNLYNPNNFEKAVVASLV